MTATDTIPCCYHQPGGLLCMKPAGHAKDHDADVIDHARFLRSRRVQRADVCGWCSEPETSSECTCREWCGRIDCGAATCPPDCQYHETVPDA